MYVAGLGLLWKLILHAVREAHEARFLAYRRQQQLCVCVCVCVMPAAARRPRNSIRNQFAGVDVGWPSVSSSQQSHLHAALPHNNTSVCLVMQAPLYSRHVTDSVFLCLTLSRSCTVQSLRQCACTPIYGRPME